MTESRKKFIKEVVFIFVAAIIVSTVFRTFFIDTRIIPSESMYPTIEVNERIFVNKMSYDFGETPQRGDIIVFTPNDTVGDSSDYIKRVIGLPGETVEVTGGVVYIDGVALEEDYIAEVPDYEFGPIVVPEGEYIVFGDNRNKSYDSHMWPYSFVYLDDIKGRAFFTYWPFSDWGSFERPTYDI